ncbi:MAG: T9SS type A sorting domain-containing protein [Melioribacteraceae bacterium]|nr:T9SS type A sorting domain-containing protein [Melioribacteraceae bacterium]
MNKIIKFSNLFVLVFLAFSLVLMAKEDTAQNKSLPKVTGSPSATHLNINQISTWIYNNGDSDINPAGNSGFIYPKGSNKAAVFETGFLWGATVEGQPRVGGSTYRSGLLPGRILPDGTAADPDDPDVRIYRVRSDWETGSVFAEVQDQGISEAEIRAQYELDWNEWPANQGAPFEDVDGDGVYDPTVDVPGFPGAHQTVWFVANDLDEAQAAFIYGSPSMGLEMQATFWGYSLAGALGNMIFRKYTIINKSGNDFVDMYVSVWSDPDVGDAGDDFVGCDTTLSLSYAFNGNPSDGIYGENVPAVGFDYFQGPIIDGSAGEDFNNNGVDDAEDYAIFNGKKVGPGKINMPMTAHYFFINSDAIYSDPDLGEYETGTLQFFNLFEGRVSTTGAAFIDPTTGLPTKFALAGDPVAGTGWIDGIAHPPGDRRMGMVSGPFTMAAGDTQEVVIAEIAAGGTGINSLQAVTLLKTYDEIAQSVYDNLFDLPSTPAQPFVQVSELDRKIILNWGYDQSRVSATESNAVTGIGGIGRYLFQGYNVYQLPNRSAVKEDGVRIATFDLVDDIKVILDQVLEPNSGQVILQPAQFGGDYGIERSILIEKDYLTNNPLNNGSKYYFAVTAYSYNADPLAVPNNLENTLVILEVTPQSGVPGIAIENDYGDTFEAEHATGISDGSVEFKVVNPDALTGHDYKVTFETLDEYIYWNNITGTTDTVHNQAVWHLQDVTTGQMKLVNQTNQNADESSPIVDGLQILVGGAPNDFADFVAIQNAGGPLDPPQAAFPYWYSHMPESFSDGDEHYNEQQVGGAWWFFSNTALSTDYLAMRSAWTGYTGGYGNNPGIHWLIPDDWEVRFTDQGSEALFNWSDPAFVANVPFEIWNVGDPNDPADDYQCVPLALDNDGDGVFDINDLDHPGSSADNDPYTDAIYWVVPQDDTPGSAGYEAVIALIKADPATAQAYYLWAYWDDDYHTWPGPMRMNFMNWNGGLVADATYNQDLPEVGTIFRIKTTKPNGPTDTFTFTAPLVAYDAELAKEDVGKVNVFPNPYYGVNSEELNKYQRFVTFNHLPEKAKITIVNLAGQVVRVIDKNSASQFERWDLANDNGLPVASGLYLAYVDMPDLGEVKVLKVAIIHEQQILDRF